MKRSKIKVDSREFDTIGTEVDSRESVTFGTAHHPRTVPKKKTGRRALHHADGWCTKFGLKPLYSTMHSFFTCTSEDFPLYYPSILHPTT